MPAVQPGPTNTYAPSHEASGKLVVDFSRNPSKFAFAKYCQIVPVKKVYGYYLEMTVEEAGRILNSDGRDFLWPDNTVAPEGHNGNEYHEFKPFRTVRKAFPFNLGQLTVDQATWNIIAQYGRIKSQQAMTERRQAAFNLMNDTNNYPAAQNLDVTNITGNSGRWDQSTTARQDIKRTITSAVELLLDNSLAAVDPDDFLLVMGTQAAAKTAQTQEIVDYIKQSPDATAQVRGELPGGTVMHGLPSKLYGLPVVVDATRKVTSKKGAATTARSSIFPAEHAYIVARPGALEGVAEAPSFSTISFMMKEEMTVETKNDADNRRVKGRVVEDYAAVMTAPSMMIRLQGITG
ncbi:MAG: hypothetical protein AAF589_03440 [Planctomycetota bacterium]